MATFGDVLTAFVNAATARHPGMSKDDRVRVSAALLRELTAAIHQGGMPAAVLPCGRVVRLGVEDLTAAAPAGT